MKRTLGILMVISLVVGMASALATPVGAATVTFTGNVTADFTGGGILTIPDPGGMADVGIPNNAPPGVVSGWNMADFRLTYDAATDILYVGINSYGIVGDVDGDGDPAGTSAWLTHNEGIDRANLDMTECIAVCFDLDQDGVLDVIAGVPGLTAGGAPGGDITGFTVANYSGFPWPWGVPWLCFGTALTPHTGTYNGNPSAASPDFEFTILNFSTLPGQDALLAGFGVWAFMGSLEDDGVGEDWICGYEDEYEQSPSTTASIASSADKVAAGSSLNLTVTEHNDGNVDLGNPQVVLTKNGGTFATVIAPPHSGDNGNGILDQGETWNWTIDSGSITGTTTFVATGGGIAPGDFPVSYPGDPDERDEVTVETTSLPQCIATSTGTGMACFTTSKGTIEKLTAVATPSGAPVELPHGMFTFEITGLSPGEEIALTVELPDPVPVGTKWWKYHNNTWSPVDIGNDDGDNLITVALRDGRAPDDEDTTPGQITDQGGPGDPGSVGWETYPINRVRVVLPWIAVLAMLGGAAGLLLLKRRGSMR